MKLQAESIWLATQPVDIHIGIDGLSLAVQQALGRAPCDGTAYVFGNRRHTRLKLVCQFAWPQAGDVAWELTDAQWQWLVAGVDWQRLAAAPPAHWQL